MNFSTTIKQNPVVIFIVLTLGLTFAIFLLPVPPESAFLAVATLAIFVPTLVAFGLVTVMNGRHGASAFLRQTFGWRSPLKWYLVALAIGFLIHLSSDVVALAAGTISAIEISTPTVFFIMFFPFALLEEIGWRGFALRRLLDQHAPFTATLIVGIPWALLHFVLFVFFSPESSPIAEGLFVLAIAFPLTWIFVKSGRSVLVATALHGAVNAFGIVEAAIPESEALSFLLVGAWLVAAAVILVDWRMWFARPSATTAGEAVPAVAH